MEGFNFGNLAFRLLFNSLIFLPHIFFHFSCLYFYSKFCFLFFLPTSFIWLSSLCPISSFVFVEVFLKLYIFFVFVLYSVLVTGCTTGNGHQIPHSPPPHPNRQKILQQKTLFYYSPSSRISSSVRTMYTVMCLHTWSSPAFCFRAGSDLRLVSVWVWAQAQLIPKNKVYFSLKRCLSWIRTLDPKITTHWL